MTDAFQARFQELLRGGALISEARSDALRGIPVRHTFTRGQHVQLSQEWLVRSPRSYQREFVVVGFSRDHTGVWVRRTYANGRHCFHHSFLEPIP